MNILSASWRETLQETNYSNLYLGTNWDKCPFLAESGVKIQKADENVLNDVVVEKSDHGIFQTPVSKQASEGESAIW